MSLLNDLKIELAAYATNFVRLEIFDVQWPRTREGYANVGDVGNFKVRVTNDPRDAGHMDIKKFTLKITGTEYADLATSEQGPFSQSITSSPPIAVDACDQFEDHSQELGPFYVLAKKRSDPRKVKIFEVNVATFDLAWEHMLLDHTGKGTTKVPYVEVIYPK